jgi:hypothetical protein
VTTRVPSGLNAAARTDPAIAATWRHDLLLLAHVAEQRFFAADRGKFGARSTTPPSTTSPAATTTSATR